MDELKKTLALKAVVLRDGQLKEVEAPQVVPGDILQVEEVSFHIYLSPLLQRTRLNHSRRVPLSLPTVASLQKTHISKSINLLLLANL